MRVILNGEPTEVPGDLSAAGLLEHLGLRAEIVVVERNEDVVRRSCLDRVLIEDGDRIEIIQMIAGG